ncbi:HAD family hydrolase [Aerococcus urinaeequi]|uniref:HAD family hydrolase n=2 Tax=Aerococcus urinaeequi TaxID=51665 RepID=UPI000845BF7D|nr:HAD family hydrolase [Aerococcus urinaeequi]
MTVKVIGFEVDGILYDRKGLYRKIYEEAQQSISKLDVSFDDFYFMLRRQSNIEYEAFFRNEKSKAEYKLDRIIQTYKFFGTMIGFEEAKVFNDYYLKYIEEIKLNDNALNLLSYLADKKYTLFILTNGSYEDQLKKLRILELDQIIPEKNWYISEKIGYSKPDKDVFDFVEEELGYQGKKIMYVGDNLRNNIIGPKRLDWKTLFYGMMNSYEFRTGRPTIYDLIEVKEYL